MLVLVLPPVSSRVSGFPVASPCLWGKLQKLVLLSCCQLWKLGSLVRNAGFSVSTCLVSSCWFSCGVAVSMGEAAKYLLFECVQAGCHVLFRVRRGTLWHSNLFDDVSKMSKLEKVSHEMVTVSLYTALHAWQCKPHTPDSTHHTLHFPLHISHSTLYSSHSTLHSLHFTLLTPHSTLPTLHPTLYTFHSTLSTPHTTLYCTLHTPHFVLYTPHSTLYTPHSTLYSHSSLHCTYLTPHSSLYTPHFTSTLQTFHPTLHTLHPTLHTLHSPPHTIHFNLYTPPFTLHTMHFTALSTPHTRHFTPHTPHSTFYTPHSTRQTLYTLDTWHSTLLTLHSTLDTVHSTLQTGKQKNMYKTVQITNADRYCTWQNNDVYWHPYHEHMYEHSGSWASFCCLLSMVYSSFFVCFFIDIVYYRGNWNDLFVAFLN